MKDWKSYQNKTYQNDVSNLLKEFLNNYTINTVIDLGCGSGNDTVYMVKKGIKVIAIDRQLNKNFILDRLNNEEQRKVTFLEKDFESVNLKNVDAVTAFFSIPFCNPKRFDQLWDKIYNCLNNNGYFVGQLFGNRDGYKNELLINTFTLEEVKQYLKKYKVLKLDEIEYVRDLDNKKWHFYEIIAQK